ncbi:MAG: glycosyltransferase family 4 protein [Deltaproteobacteria bacterium]|jgi:glycosyltransferase involved in cell wall biosynthesis|nr:glycosyltransferase family 4 protein [Deltaproteobacteria bacterium]
MKAVALVSDAFGGRGGIALYNRNVLNALCRYDGGSQVTALPRLVSSPPGPMPAELDYRLEAQGSKLAYCLAAAKLAVRRRDLDLIVASHIHLLPIAEPLRRLTGAPIVLFVYGVDAWTRRDWLTARLVERIDVLVSIRQHTIERLREWADLSHVRCHVLENAIHLEQYAGRTRRPDLVERYRLEGKRVLMTLARVDEVRFGFDEILEVLPDLVEEMPDLVYLAVGGGSQLDRLRRKAKQLGVADHVVFTGAVREEDKADYYYLADAFAMPGSHPTQYDRYPLRFVFLEAMACGLPVVASRPEELADDADSPLPNIYVDPDDREDLKRGLRAGLARGAGDVPQQARYYDYPNFEKRLHTIVDQALRKS